MQGLCSLCQGAFHMLISHYILQYVVSGSHIIGAINSVLAWCILARCVKHACVVDLLLNNLVEVILRVKSECRTT